MAILSHGSDLSLAPTLGPLVRQTGWSVTQIADELARRKCQSVQLDATLSGTRPGDLDKRARQDLTAALGRRSLGIAGIDLFIPRQHYLSEAHVDRAMAATFGAMTLAADLGRVPLSIALPVKDMDASLLDAIVAGVDGHGIPLAVHGEDQLPELCRWLDEVDLARLGAGFDPAAAVVRGEDACQSLHTLGKRLTVARVSDVQPRDAVRCPLGQGGLEVSTYRMTVDLMPSRIGPVVLDLHGLPRPLEATAQAAACWEDAATQL